MKKILLSFLCLVFYFFYTSNGFAIDPSDAPDSLTIDSIKNLYDGVEFDHESHVDFAEENCAECHHNTVGVPMKEKRCSECHQQSITGREKVACGDCHSLQPFAAVQLKKMEERFLYHIDKPSLKAAYHLNCLMCHKEQGAPTGCNDCHKMTVAGERFFDTGPYAPKSRGDHEKGNQ